MKLHAIVSDLETARVAGEGGATVIQLRLKDTPTEEVIERGTPIRLLCEQLNVTFVVNDDVDASFVGEISHFSGEVRGLRVDPMFGAQLFGHCQFVVAS